MQKRTIKAILFDSGKVLNQPATGHWFITPNFWQHVDKVKYQKIDSKKVSRAFREANKYIEAQSTIITKEDEYQYFLKFYTIFSENVPELEMGVEQIEAVAKDLVFNPLKYVFYKDALEMIPQLASKYQLGIVSDAWPSLLDVYREQNFEDYFETIVISSMIGVTKPHEKMYITALEALNISVEQAVFVDDNLQNCIGAMKVGIHSVLLCRNKWLYLWNKITSIGKGYDVICRLKELKKIT